MRPPGNAAKKKLLWGLSFVLVLSFLPHAMSLTNGTAATVAIGEQSLTAFSPRASQSGLVAPTGAAFDSSGNLWVADQGANRVLDYKAPLSTGEAATLVVGQTSFTALAVSTSPTGLNSPEAVAFDPGGNMWVVDAGNNRVLEYRAPFSTGEAASLVIGQPDFTSSATTTSATGLNQPESVAFDSSGNMWVADGLNSRVLEYKSPLSTGEAATLVLGEKDFVSAIDQATKAGMSTPSGLAFDSSGNLWVADGIRVLEYSTPFVTHEAASLVIGQNTFTNSSTVADSKGLNLPRSVAFDSSQNLWVGDYGNNRVLEYTAPLSTYEAASLVLGQKDFTSSSTTPATAPTASGLNHPWGVAFDSKGNVWVADYADGRVLGYGSSSGGVASSSATSSASSTTKSSSSVSSSAPGISSSKSSTSASSSTSAASSPVGATTTSSSSSGGGVPAFPYQALIATVFTALLAASYLLVRRGARLHRSPQTGPSRVSSVSGST